MSSDSSDDETHDFRGAKRIAEHDNELGENSKKKRFICENDRDSQVGVSQLSENNEGIRSDKDKFYRKGGLVNSLHGDIYQLKLQMLFLKRALDNNYTFQLGTEVEDAEKFDDIVLKFKRKGQTGIYEIRFLQGKHKLNESTMITASDLLSSNDDDFSLQKYFVSYRKIKQNSEFNTSKLKDFIIYTNIDFDHDKLNKASIYIEEINEDDDILKVTKSNNSVKRFKLALPKRHALYDALKETSDLHILAKTLAQHVLKHSPLHKVGIFNKYHHALSKTVLRVNVPCATFREQFINGEDLSAIVNNFRNILQSCLKFENDDQFKEKLRQTKLDVSEAFAFETHVNPVIDDYNGVAKTLAKIIINAKSNVITITRRKGGVIDANINKFAFNLLVQDDHENGLVKFAKTFLDETRQLAGNLEDFRVEFKAILQRHGIEFLALGQYKFKISNFYTCDETLEGTLRYPETELPDNEVEDVEIEDFFNKLVFAVNQPNEVKLGEIIAKEMGQSSQFNLLDATMVSNSFQNQMLDWFKQKRSEKGKEGVWLDGITGKEFMNSIEQKVGVLICVGINIAYPEKLSSYEIRFENNDITEKLKSFLSKENVSKKIFYISTPENETIFSAINVYGSLEILKQHLEFAQYRKNDSYIFMRINTLSREKTQRYVLDAFKTMSNYNLLIVDCKSSIPFKASCVRLFIQLSDILMNSNKKLIIIANPESNIINYFAEDLMSCVTDDSSFADLTDKSKRILLEKQVTFQGRSVKICLSELIDQSDEKTKELIDTDVMVNLLKDKEISIGSKLKDLCEINKYYIKRKFKSVALNKEDIQKQLEKGSMLSDLFVISGADSGLKHDHVHAFHNAQSAAEKYNQLRVDDNYYNIHWLKSDSRNLTWYKSHGSVANLLPYTMQKSYMNNLTRPRLIEEKGFVNDDDHRDKLRIICGSAGMGKSTVLTNMSMELINDPSLWVIRINLNDYTENLDKLDTNKILESLGQSKDNLIEFLLNELSVLKGQSRFDKKLFANSFNSNPKVAFLIDGFDEISPDYTSIIVSLLDALLKCNIKNIFVTTRPNFRQILEKSFNAFAYFLEPFSKEEQIEYLMKYWTKKIDLARFCTNKLKKYAECTIEQICKCINDNGQVFVSIPLQLMIIAEVFQENISGMTSERQGCKEFLKSDVDEPKILENYSLVKLYENFVERKYYDFYLADKKIKDLTKVPAKKKKRISKKEYNIFKKENGLLALKLLFNSKELNKMLSQAEMDELNDLIADFSDGEHLKGIIDEIIDGKPHFVHRTFAEYFASFPVADKILAAPSCTLQCINNALTDISPIFMHGLIEQFEGKLKNIELQLDQPLLQFIVMDSCSNFLKLLIQSNYSDWHKKLDVFWKSPLHYAVSECDENDYAVSECDENDSEEYVFREKTPTISETHKKVKKILKFADDLHVNEILKHGSFKYPEYADSLLVKFINLQDIDNKTALHYAIKQQRFDVAFELLLKGAEIDSLTDGSVTALIRHMLRSSHNVDLYNDGILRVYADQDNKYRAIEEKLFLRAPQIFNTLSIWEQSRILSFFFVQGRVQVIEAMLATIEDLEERKLVLKNIDNSYTSFDRVLKSEHLTDETRLTVTKYLLENDALSMSCTKYNNRNPSSIDAVLLAAAEYGHIQTLKYFMNLKKHGDFNLVVYHACECNQLEILKYIHENYKERINDAHGNTALHAACDIVRGVNLEIFKYLIDNNDINAVNDNGETPLVMAKRWQKQNVIDYLISKGAVEECSVVNHDKVYDNQSLHAAIDMKKKDLAKSLIRQGADVNEKDANGNAPLHLCLNKVNGENDNKEIVELLLQYGAMFDARNGNNKTPCDLLFDKSNSDEISEDLLFFRKSKLVKSTIHEMEVYWLFRILERLFSSRKLTQALNLNLLGDRKWANWGPYGQGIPDSWDGCNPMLFILNAHNSNGKTLFHVIADTNDVEAFHTLLKFNHDYMERKRLESKICPRYSDYQPVSIDGIDFDGNAPIHLAARKGHERIIHILLDEGAIFNSIDAEGKTPEELAQSNNHTDIVNTLLTIKHLFCTLEEKKVFKSEEIKYMYNNVKNQNGLTPLHLAAVYDQQAVQWLLENYANIKAIDTKGNTPLHIAAKNDKYDIVVLLIKYGAKYEVANNEGHKPLDLARGQTRDLFEKIDTTFKGIQSDDRQTAFEKFKIYDKETGAIVRSCDLDGNTLLHHAAKIGDYNIVEYLLQNGAIFDSNNEMDITPVELTYAQNIKSLLQTVQKMFLDVNYVNEALKTVNKKVIINVLDSERKGLLYYATEFGNAQIISTLKTIMEEE